MFLGSVCFLTYNLFFQGARCLAYLETITSAGRNARSFKR